MVTRIQELAPPKGSKRARSRVGRGTSGVRGKTAGRGTKGQKARGQIRRQFEGGQLPMVQRSPKLAGFKNPFRVEYTVVNLESLAGLAETEIDPGVMRQHGLVAKKGFVKVLGEGTLSKSVTVKAHAFSKSAREAIASAGGSVEILPKPYKVRPAAQGNALTNR